MTTISEPGRSALEAGVVELWAFELEDGSEVFVEAYTEDVEVSPGEGPVVRFVSDAVCAAYTPTEALDAVEYLRRSPVLTAGNRTDIASTLGCPGHGPFLTIHEVDDLAEALGRAALLAAEGAARARLERVIDQRDRLADALADALEAHGMPGGALEPDQEEAVLSAADLLVELLDEIGRWVPNDRGGGWIEWHDRSGEFVYGHTVEELTHLGHPVLADRWARRSGMGDRATAVRWADEVLAKGGPFHAIPVPDESGSGVVIQYGKSGCDMLPVGLARLAADYIRGGVTRDPDALRLGDAIEDAAAAVLAT